MALQKLYDLEDSELALLIYLATKSEAREVLDILEIDDVSADDGLESLWQLLDEAYDKRDHEKSDEAAANYRTWRRTPGMSMDAYISGLEKRKRAWLS